MPVFLLLVVPMASPDAARERNAVRHAELCDELGLPELSSFHPLSAADVEAYRQDGYVVCEAFLTAEELTAYAPAIRAEAMRLLREDGMGLTFGGAFHQRLNLRYQSPVFEAYCLAPRFGDLGAALAGVDRMRIYHEQVLFKPPGADATFWHQDMYFWPLVTEQSLGTWLPLTDVSPAMGGLRYAAGSHKLGNLGQHSINEASEAFFDGVIADEGLDAVQLPLVEAGDLCIHNGWMVHGAAGNYSSAMREAVVVTMYPDGTRVGPLDNDFRRADAADYLGGRAEGELADSALNTIF